MDSPLLSAPERRRSDLYAASLALCALLLFTYLALCIHPLGFFGGGYDDEQYVRAGINWIEHFPYLGDTHWALRHPFNLLLALAYLVSGVSQEASVVAGDAPIFALVVVTFLAIRITFDTATACLTCVFVASLPLIARGAVAIEPTELFLSVTSLWCFVFSAKKSDSMLLLALSGVLLGLAWQTRETSGALVLLYGLSFAFFPIFPRKNYAVLAVAAAAPILLEMSYYYVRVGDIFYRYHVDANHIHLSKAAQMLNRGANYGLPLFNLSVARSWQPSDDFFHVNWIVDPYLSLFASPKAGFVALISLVGVGTWRWSERPSFRTPLGLFLTAGVIWFLFATYVLTIRPEPRYYSFTFYSASLIAASGLVNLFRRRFHLLAAALFVGLVSSNFVFVDLGERNQEAYDLVAYLRSHQTGIFIPKELSAQFDVGHRDARLVSYLLSQPKKGALVLGLKKSCPAESTWCSASEPSAVSIVLKSAGLEKFFSERAWQRIERRRSVAILTETQ